MRLKTKHILYGINIVTIVLVFCIALLPNNILRIILGLLLVLFFPGYSLLAALFPRRVSLDSLENIALSFGMSIAISSLIGLVLNYTSWGIRLYPILISLAIFIFATSIVAWCRVHKFQESDGPVLSINLKPFLWAGRTRMDRILSAVLATAILGALVTLIWVISMPKNGEKFTEFYILGLDGKADSYPRDLELGANGNVIIGIINQELETMSYRVETKIDGVTDNINGPIVLISGNKSESSVGFTPRQIGDNQEVQFLLYKNGQDEPYRELHLWINAIKTPR